MRVLYVTGWCRTGSTLLGNLLGEVPGVAHTGEVHYLWRNGVLRTGTNTTCGCGAPVADCPLWSAVLDRVAGPAPVELARSTVHGQGRFLRTRHAGARLAESTGRRRRPAGVQALLDRMVAVYRAVAAVTGADLVIDSSKYPAEAAALAGRADLDLRVLHLVRDPRATAYSWLRPKSYIPAMGVLRSSGYWAAANLASDRIGRAVPAGRYLRLRYEDFAADPHATLGRLMAFAGLDGEPPVSADGRAELGANHTVTGNPDRLVHGTVHVRPDTGWRERMGTRDAATATLVAGPLLRRYGYSLHR